MLFKNPDWFLMFKLDLFFCIQILKNNIEMIYKRLNCIGLPFQTDVILILFYKILKTKNCTIFISSSKIDPIVTNYTHPSK